MVKRYAWKKFGWHDARSIEAHDEGRLVSEYAHHVVASFWLWLWDVV